MVFVVASEAVLIEEFEDVGFRSFGALWMGKSGFATNVPVSKWNVVWAVMACLLPGISPPSIAEGDASLSSSWSKLTVMGDTLARILGWMGESVGVVCFPDFCSNRRGKVSLVTHCRMSGSRIWLTFVRWKKF
jgi:hypothetical protein